MKFERTTVHNIEGSIYSMRMPMMSHNKSDSYTDDDGNFVIGEADMKLALNLVRGGDPHAKFLRTIYIDTVITAPKMWISEQDTYKIVTVRNSSSIMHKGASRDYTIDDFTFDGKTEEEIKDFQTVVELINKYRRKYIETKDYRYFRIMRELIGDGYNYTYSWSTNYAQLRNMYYWRVKEPHRLKEWTEDFAGWIDTLPYNEFIKL